MTPWESNPYKLTSWWNMAKFNSHLFCSICALLNSNSEQWQRKKDEQMAPVDREETLRHLRLIAEECKEAGIATSAAYIRENLKFFEDIEPLERVAYSMFLSAFGNLQLMIKSEMKQVEYLRVDKPEFYGTVSRFEPFITDIYSQLSYDIVEAGNCLALDRTTACVFHLMRVMEFGVRSFGDKLGVPLVSEPVWQVIMDQVNARIKAMPEKPAAKKRTKEAYAEVAGHLYNVKVAWRNPVMHPKRTYTAEEAEHLFVTVRMFMSSLTRLLKPKSVTKSIAERKRLIEAGSKGGLFKNEEKQS